MTIHPITVFTPTFNRAYCLDRAYKSLCRQTCKDFEWLVIDDGSTDETCSLIHQWQEENIIPIRYIYQENQGMHGAHNTAFRNISTELCICLDSDDMLTDDCIEFVLKFWQEHAEEHGKVAGFIALDAYMDGKIIGTKFPEGVKIAHDNQLREIAKVKGDKKIIYRTKIAQEAPEYPVFLDEKYGSMGYKQQYIDAKYPWLIINRVIYLVEYMPDGSTRNMYKQYRRALKGWDIARKSSMIHSYTLRRKFIECVHYVSNSIFLHKWDFIQDSPKTFLTILAVFPGILLNIFIRYKTRS